MNSRSILVLLAIAAAAIGTYFAVGMPKSEAPHTTTLSNESLSVVEASKSVAPAPLQSAPAPSKAPADPKEMIRYPDGSYMPPLNGVKYPAGLQWPPEFPYSPIVGKQFSGQVEWYVHADGTQTTTQMVWRSDLGRNVAVTHVARPMPAAPLESDG